MTESSPVLIKILGASDRADVAGLVRKHWGSEKIVSRGRIHDTGMLPGLVAIWSGSVVGELTYRLDRDEVEIITISSEVPDRGIGSQLLQRLMATLSGKGIRRIWLVTTNDNLNALKFFQKNNFTLKAVYPNSLVDSRKLKPEIPLIGQEGIPLRDEIELEKRLSA